uniref:Uncharacterized protein n=1 Tax=Siphoviridae sp. ctfZQ2 TaxID=2826415 RepID=A0A8S5NAN1_9CAUD|nr:MAG TPA: hypothetical protein [Siphoviridae sp. ctfZQ2]
MLMAFSFNVFMVFPSGLFCYFLKLDYSLTR